MSTRVEVQVLLRFLVQDAKQPMAKAMGYIRKLQAAGLTTPALIKDAKADMLESIFDDEKTAKQVLNAAKRFGKKRSAAGAASNPSRPKKRSSAFELTTPEDIERSLQLPIYATDEDEISRTVLVTNRAPVVLAFGVVLLQYTMPEQPLSSRLSLAQAAVSMNSRSKAISLGIESGKSADEEGWGVGQASVRVMGRDVRTMKRVGWKAASDDPGISQPQEASNEERDRENFDHIALWGLDLEALKKSSSTDIRDGTGVGLASDLPIHTPQSARSYLLKAFDSKHDQQTLSSTRTPSTSSSQAQKEKNLGLLLGALDLLFKSWSPALSKEALDQRAWSWYIQTRPSVPDGVSGWGAKGELRLSSILQLRKASHSS